MLASVSDKTQERPNTLLKPNSSDPPGWGKNVGGVQRAGAFDNPNAVGFNGTLHCAQVIDSTC